MWQTCMIVWNVGNVVVVFIFSVPFDFSFDKKNIYVSFSKAKIPSMHFKKNKNNSDGLS